MYLPSHFRQTDTEALFGFIQRNPLALLVTAGSGGLVANPLPFFVSRARDGEDKDRLIAHMARANPQWQAIEAGDEVLISFMGADHYVSPNWYPSKQESGKVVPTWNYQIVQVRGTTTVHHDAAWLLDQVNRLTDQQEAKGEHPWAVNDAPEPFVTARMRGIVGLELAITAIEGKLKASQNRTEADRKGVIDGLESEGKPQAEAMADVMRSLG
ncbi:FMN-binding negative transcriptional regulator [Allorhizobium taibaishanense]|uniref:Transcriptional regulator n=1 Tax=Allorhizobium taibaishanense TaxID=887144 RepID=A0A1Q9A4S5_9HYPH|nr:FMN-binding negative transcriptional regulator [Allorhizobium taibaishanense]MBB4006659.1 transcriptional regulator [Allorhizobium taibaishanense]OLP49572.1 transcriptional regulator [Allorhizobium taibaishanense]